MGKTTPDSAGRATPQHAGKRANQSGPQKSGGQKGGGPDPARAGALRLLKAWRLGEAPANPEAALEDLAPQDRAAALRLALETLRMRGRADHVIAALTARAPRPEIRDILRLALTEMLALGTAAHAGVDMAVRAAKAGGPKTRAGSGMVNAVARKAAQATDLWQSAGPTPLPDWLRAPLVAQHGRDITRAIEAAHERGAPLDFSAKPAAQAPGAALPTGSFRLHDPARVTALAGYEQGDWWVQDAAAALPARLLAPKSGQRVLDLCAAPGGKTLQLAAMGAEVTALDISEHRLGRLRENLSRCGLSAQIVAADALEWTPDAPFDAILLDAPCSATGTIRRHPELPLLRDGTAIAELAELQARLLDRALGWLAPGGVLVYATCSLLDAEGEDQIKAALARHDGLTVERPDSQALSPSLSGIAPDWVTPAGGLRTRPDFWPESGGMDGFYMARLRRS